MLCIDDILRAADMLAPYIFRTPTLESGWLSAKSNGRVWVKWEQLQLTGSFKLRGALYCMMLAQQQGVREVLAVSAGNHGLGVAVAARMLGMRATVIVPHTAAVNKMKAIKEAGAELLLLGRDYDEAEIAARPLAAERGSAFISPYNDLNLIAGQGTVALELFEECKPELIFVPVGGGGLLAGCAIVAAALSPETEIWGVQPQNSTAMYSSLQAGSLITVSEQPTLADGLAGNIEPGSVTFPLIKKLVKGIRLVSEEEIETAIVSVVKEDKFIIEGSGAVAVASLLNYRLEGRSAALVVSGRNIDAKRLYQILQKYPL